jgi:hypothetical protein
LIFISAGAVSFFFLRGNLSWYGDAESHLDIARRIVDSRTPGYDQVGLVWLPLPHWAMVPFAAIDALWFNALAGSIPSAIAYILAGCYLCGAARRLFRSDPAAMAATALFALNPNVLYLQSIAMSESIFFACLMALLYYTVRFRDTQSLGSVAAAGVAACAGTLTRYDFWLILPFAAAYFLVVARRRFAAAILFSAIAALGPLFWLFHNWWLTMDPLDFYRGPWSARAIQRGADYPGKGDWPLAFLYYRTAAQLCAGACLPLIALVGVVAAVYRRAFWALLLLALPGIFYVWSMHSTGGTPIFIPVLKPFSYYNTRYGLAVLPLMALAAAALVAVVPAKVRAPLALLMVVAASIPWIVHPTPSAWITWEESRVNSETRRAWQREAAQYLGPRYVHGTGILTNCGELSGVFREMRIPLRETFSCDNGLPFAAAVLRPELFLHEEWVVTTGGAKPQSAVNRLRRQGVYYGLEKTIIMKDAPVIEIYRR